jgi:hypothetical protein
MKLALQYLSDSDGNPQAVQLSLTDWEKVVTRLKKYEQTLSTNQTWQKRLKKWLL